MPLLRRVKVKTGTLPCVKQRAAAGLATVVRAMVDRKRLAEALHLRPAQRIALAQTVGYPVP